MCMPLQGFRSTYTISTPECSLHLCVAAEWLLTHLAMQTNTSHAQAQAHTGAVHPATQGRRIQRRALPQRGPRPPPRGLSAAQHSPPATPQKRCRAARQRGHPRLPGLQAAAPWGGRRAARRQLHTRPLSRLRQRARLHWGRTLPRLPHCALPCRVPQAWAPHAPALTPGEAAGARLHGPHQPRAHQSRAPGARLAARRRPAAQPGRACRARPRAPRPPPAAPPAAARVRAALPARQTRPRCRTPPLSRRRRWQPARRPPARPQPRDPARPGGPSQRPHRPRRASRGMRC